MKRSIFTIIKFISIILISSAIGLELWNIYALLTHSQMPSGLNPIFWIERIAVTVHLVEAGTAAFYAPSKQKIPLKYGTYTFFVGTIGLLELFDE